MCIVQVELFYSTDKRVTVHCGRNVDFERRLSFNQVDWIVRTDINCYPVIFRWFHISQEVIWTSDLLAERHNETMRRRQAVQGNYIIRNAWWLVGKRYGDIRYSRRSPVCRLLHRRTELHWLRIQRWYPAMSAVLLLAYQVLGTVSLYLLHGMNTLTCHYSLAWLAIYQLTVYSFSRWLIMNVKYINV